MIERLALGLLGAAVIAGGAWRANTLTRSGAAAAVFVGGAATMPGYGWAALLITFFVIMLAFSCGVSYMFNYLTDGTGSSTGGVFTYFFWVLLQVGFVVLHVLHLTEGTGSRTGSTGSFSR